MCPLTMNFAGLVSALHAETRETKIALKQAHGGSIEGRQGYAATLGVSSTLQSAIFRV
jgi:hypothetical protein